MYGVADIRGCSGCQAVTDVHEISTWNNEQEIPPEVLFLHPVQLERTDGQEVEVVADQEGFDRLHIVW